MAADADVYKKMTFLENPEFETLCGRLESMTTTLSQLDELTQIMNFSKATSQEIDAKYQDLEGDDLQQMAPELSQVVRGFASRTQEPIQKSIQSAIALEETFTKQYGELMQGIVGESLTKLKTFNSEATQLELISAGPDARVANEKKRRSSTLLESIAQTGSLPGADPPPEGY